MLILGTGAAPSYTGPLDLVPGAMMAYSQRAMSAARRGTALYTVERITDETTQSFSSDAVTGAAPSAAISSFIGTALAVWQAAVVDGGAGYDGGSPSTFDVTVVGGTHSVAAVVNVSTDGSGTVVTVNSITTRGAYSVAPTNPVDTTGDNGVDHGTGLTLSVEIGVAQVTLWNDQSGNGKDMIGASSPYWEANIIDGQPGIVGNGSAGFDAPDLTFPDGAVTIFLVAGLLTELFVFNNSGNAYLDVFMGRPTRTMYIDMVDEAGNEAGGTYDTPADAIHLMDAAWEFGSASLKLNGTEITQISSFDAGGAVAAFTTDSGSLSATVHPDEPITSKCIELLVYSGLLSGADRLAIRQNIAAYYGIILA